MKHFESNTFSTNLAKIDMIVLLAIQIKIFGHKMTSTVLLSKHELLGFSISFIDDHNFEISTVIRTATKQHGNTNKIMNFNKKTDMDAKCEIKKRNLFIRLHAKIRCFYDV